MDKICEVLSDRNLELRRAKFRIYQHLKHTVEEEAEDKVLAETIEEFRNEGKKWQLIKIVAETFSQKIGRAYVSKRVGEILIRNGFINRKPGSNNFTLVLLQKTGFND